MKGNSADLLTGVGENKKGSKKSLEFCNTLKIYALANVAI